MNQAQICPVCNGKGIVPNGFYNITNPTYISTSTAPESCRTCCGSGMVIVPNQDYNEFISSPKTKKLK